MGDRRGRRGRGRRAPERRGRGHRPDGHQPVRLPHLRSRAPRARRGARPRPTCGTTWSPGWRRSDQPERSEVARGTAKRHEHGVKKGRIDAASRLRRLLAVVPWVLEHQGAPLTDVAARFGVTVAELEADFELLQYCGLPPYSPDRLIDCQVTDGRVTLRFAEYFNRPISLTPAEGFTLLAAGQTLLAVPGADPDAALAAALAKLADALDAAGGVAVELRRGARSSPPSVPRSRRGSSWRSTTTAPGGTPAPPGGSTRTPSSPAGASGTWTPTATWPAETACSASIGSPPCRPPARSSSGPTTGPVPCRHRLPAVTRRPAGRAAPAARGPVGDRDLSDRVGRHRSRRPAAGGDGRQFACLARTTPAAPGADGRGGGARRFARVPGGGGPPGALPVRWLLRKGTRTRVRMSASGAA